MRPLPAMSPRRAVELEMYWLIPWLPRILKKLMYVWPSGFTRLSLPKSSAGGEEGRRGVFGVQAGGG